MHAGERDQHEWCGTGGVNAPMMGAWMEGDGRGAGSRQQAARRQALANSWCMAHAAGVPSSAMLPISSCQLLQAVSG
jgi:hypothetical protein